MPRGWALAEHNLVVYEVSIQIWYKKNTCSSWCTDRSLYICNIKQSVSVTYQYGIIFRKLYMVLILRKFTTNSTCKYVNNNGINNVENVRRASHFQRIQFFLTLKFTFLIILTKTLESCMSEFFSKFFTTHNKSFLPVPATDLSCYIYCKRRTASFLVLISSALSSVSYERQCMSITKAT